MTNQLNKMCELLFCEDMIPGVQGRIMHPDMMQIFRENTALMNRYVKTADNFNTKVKGKKRKIIYYKANFCILYSVICEKLPEYVPRPIWKMAGKCVDGMLDTTLSFEEKRQFSPRAQQWGLHSDEENVDKCEVQTGIEALSYNCYLFRYPTNGQFNYHDVTTVKHLFRYPTRSIDVGLLESGS